MELTTSKAPVIASHPPCVFRSWFYSIFFRQHEADGIPRPPLSPRTHPAHTALGCIPFFFRLHEADGIQYSPYHGPPLPSPFTLPTCVRVRVLRSILDLPGNGLNELLSSLRTERRIDARTQQRIRSIAAMRNKLVHSVDANNLTISNTFGTSARK